MEGHGLGEMVSPRYADPTVTSGQGQTPGISRLTQSDCGMIPLWSGSSSEPGCFFEPERPLLDPQVLESCSFNTRVPRRSAPKCSWLKPHHPIQLWTLSARGWSGAPFLAVVFPSTSGCSLLSPVPAVRLSQFPASATQRCLPGFRSFSTRWKIFLNSFLRGSS